MLLPLAIVGLVLTAVFHRQLQNLTGIGSWKGETPLVCDSNDVIEVDGVTATFEQGSAVVARGNCQVTLKSCRIKAGTAIEADGNARVTVVGGSIEGTAAAVDARSNASVDLLGNVKTRGALRRTSNARVTGN